MVRDVWGLPDPDEVQLPSAGGGGWFGWAPPESGEPEPPFAALGRVLPLPLHPSRWPLFGSLASHTLFAPNDPGPMPVNTPELGDGVGDQIAQAPTEGASSGSNQPNPRTGVQVTLPGFGPTYLDSEFADRLNKFEQYAGENGVMFKYSSGYRTPERQTEIRTRGEGTTPARRSLHSAGLVVDIDYLSGNRSEREQKILRDAAARAGLSWGGTFRDPDPNHFFFGTESRSPRSDRQFH